MQEKARNWIDRLRLRPHPEGGWFHETYRSAEIIPATALPERFHGERCFSTAICFLLEGEQFSAFHRIASDELWHFYCGSTLAIHVIAPDGEYSKIRLGHDPDAGAVLQGIVPAGCWFGAELEDRQSYGLAGCTVAPGFDFADFEIATRNELSMRYPQHQSIIRRLTQG